MRLIDADALKEAVNRKRVVGRFNTIQLIDNAPTVDTTFKEVVAYECGQKSVERPHGEWIGDTDFDNTCKCSECRMTFDTDRLKMVMCDGKYELPPCCPNCGADMRGGKE